MPPFDSSMTQLILWAVLGYLMGSVPFGMIVAKVMGLGNPRAKRAKVPLSPCHKTP